MNPALQARRFLISGLVQGVGFRMFAVEAAARAHVSGFTRNLPDGRVEVYAMGASDQLNALRRELEKGPRFASVSEVTEENAPVDPCYSGEFQIEHDR